MAFEFCLKWLKVFSNGLKIIFIGSLFDSLFETRHSQNHKVACYPLPHGSFSFLNLMSEN